MLLKTERLILQEVCIDDCHKLLELHADPKVSQFNTLQVPENQDTLLNIIVDAIDDQRRELRKSYLFTVILHKGNVFVGDAGLTLSADRFNMGEIFYSLAPEYWGQGFATEIARELLRFGFEDLKLHRIEAGVASENRASARVLEKAGLQREGLRRKILPIRGEWKDNYLYAIISGEFC